MHRCKQPWSFKFEVLWRGIGFDEKKNHNHIDWVHLLWKIIINHNIFRRNKYLTFCNRISNTEIYLSKLAYQKHSLCLSNRCCFIYRFTALCLPTHKFYLPTQSKVVHTNVLQKCHVMVLVELINDRLKIILPV